MSYYERKYWDGDRDKPRTGKIFWTVVGVVVGLSVLFGLLGFGLGWFNRGVEVVSPKNVTEQYDRVITEWEALKTSANNACGAQQAANNENSPQLVEDPAFAYAATFRKITVSYNSRQKNIFEAGLVGPAGYPKEVPLGLDQGPDTDWCDVASTLAAIK